MSRVLARGAVIAGLALVLFEVFQWLPSPLLVAIGILLAFGGMAALSEIDVAEAEREASRRRRAG